MLVQQKSVPDDATVVVIAGPRTDFLQPEIDALKAYVGTRRQGAAAARPGRDKPAPTRARRCSQAFLHDWGIGAGNDVVLDASGIGQMLGTDASVPVAAQYPVASDHGRLRRR